MNAVTQLYSSTPEVPGHVIVKFAHGKNVSIEQAQRQFEEVRKFLAVCATDREAAYAPSAILDEAWHAFVLHTGDYSGYCDRFLGGFVHHRPSDRPEVAAYQRTLAVLRATFGDLDTMLWPHAEAADCDSGSCENYCSDGPPCNSDGTGGDGLKPVN